MSTSIDDLRHRHTRWLERGGMLERPWLILGSAPDPTLPVPLDPRVAHVHINNAGLTAHARGLPPADLTYRAGRKPMTPLNGLSSRNMLWVTSQPRLPMRLRALYAIPLRVERAETLSFRDRDRIVEAVIGTEIRSVGVYGKPSSGVAAIAYALFCGVPEVIVAGISVELDGYSYEAPPEVRKQKEEDRFALAELAKRHPGIATSEPALAAATGLRPVGSAEAAPTRTRAGVSR